MHLSSGIHTCIQTYVRALIRFVAELAGYDIDEDEEEEEEEHTYMHACV